MAIKNINRDPKSSEFSKNEIVINSKDGGLFYKTNNNVVNKIPYGKYLSYEQVATKAGNPRAARAAGTANAMNTIPIIIPCHRVLAKHGKLGGYGGGIKIKKYLLKLESIK